MRRKRAAPGGAGLRALFRVGGVVATAAGLHTALTGARSIAGQGTADPSVESELRFYAAFYVAYGLGALHVAPRADRDATAVRALAGTLFAAGLARTGGWLAVGRPHAFQRGLLVVELAGPPLVVAWQRRVALDASRTVRPALRMPSAAFHSLGFP